MTWNQNMGTEARILVYYIRNLFLHCFRVYFASWKCFYLSPSLSRFPGSLRARRKKLRQEKKVWGRRKKYQAGEKGFFFLLVGHSGFRLTRLNDQIALWSSGDLLFLKLPFAVRPGLTGSRAKMQSNTGLIFRCQGVKVSQGGWLVVMARLARVCGG